MPGALHLAIFLAALSCCRASVLPSTVAAPRGPITCVAEDPEFERLVVGGLGNQGEVISEHEQALFHEAGVWLPETGEWLFTSNRMDDNGPRIKVHVLHAKSRTLTECDEVQAAVVMANGGTSDGAGGVLLCSQGMGEVGGAIYRVSPTRCSAAPLVEARFNSPNDVVLHGPTGAILFTDPSYGVEQGFRSARHHEHEALWCFVPAAEGAEAPPPVHCLDRNFVKPNGLCLSPDGATLYVTDSGYFDGYGGADRRVEASHASLPCRLPPVGLPPPSFFASPPVAGRGLARSTRTI